MNHYEVPFVDFYKQHNISPVAQDISDLTKHFERRNALYRQCGIPALLITGREVLEIGPGTGHNALFTNAFKPSKYVLLDGNPTSLEKTITLLSDYYEDTSNCEFVESNIYDFKSNRQFDVVLCEGVIPLQKEPKHFLKLISQFVKPSGLLLITCIDHVSFLSEYLRKVAALILIQEKELDKPEQLKILRDFFTPHLKHLNGMSRSIDDWIYDNILQPFIGKLFSIEDAIAAISDEFDAYSTSPNFTTDWRWYKDIHGVQQRYSQRMIDSFRENAANFLDCRYQFEPVNAETSNKISTLCQSIFDVTLAIQNEMATTALLRQLRRLLLKLSEVVAQLPGETSLSINQFAAAIDQYLAGNGFPQRLDKFEPWFGRCQQYVSFVRKEPFTTDMRATGLQSMKTRTDD